MRTYKTRSNFVNEPLTSQSNKIHSPRVRFRTHEHATTQDEIHNESIIILSKQSKDKLKALDINA